MLLLFRTKKEDGWYKLNPIKQEYEEEINIYWHSRSYGDDFINNYTLQAICFNDFNVEDQIKYVDSYNEIKNGASIWEVYYPKYYLMNLTKMFKDFNNNIHEYAGIISKNDCLILQDNSEYEPTIISPHDFNKLPKRIQDNYIYYAWDTPWSEYIHIYGIIPIINDMVQHYNLRLDDIRLVYEIS